MLLTAGFASDAKAHSLDEVNAMLQSDEKYFQTIDKPAPDFALRTADGRVVRLADLRGKVVVLHFIYTSCPDVCPLHAEKVAAVQAMVNATPMRSQVVFVSVTTDPSRRRTLGISKTAREQFASFMPAPAQQTSGTCGAELPLG